MAFDYAKSRDTAKKLIESFGYASSFYTPAVVAGPDEFDAEGNPATGTPEVRINGTITPLLEYKSITMYGSMEQAGTSIQSGDKYCFFHSDTKVSIGMLVDADSKTWRVISIAELDSGTGIQVYQKLQLRTGG